jgi:hypothetical protein
MAVVERIQSRKIGIPAVHDIQGSRLDGELVEEIDIVHGTVGNAQKTGDRALQVEQGVHLDGAFVFAKLGPGKQGQTQVDGRRVEGVDRLIQFDAERLVGIQRPRVGDQPLGQVGIDSPRSSFVGVGQRAFGHRPPKPDMIQFGMKGPQTGLDVAETFAKSQLGEDHAEKLVVARKGSVAMVAPIPTDTGVERMARNEIHQLRENHAIEIHEAALSNTSGRFLYRSSNRKQPFSLATLCHLRGYRKFSFAQPDSSGVNHVFILYILSIPVKIIPRNSQIQFSICHLKWLPILLIASKICFVSLW